MSEGIEPAVQPAAEADALLAVLERNRRTFAWKTLDLDEQGLRATTGASAMTLGGLVMHVALVEADWLAVKLAGQALRATLGRGGLRRRPGLGVAHGGSVFARGACCVVASRRRTLACARCRRGRRTRTRRAGVVRLAGWSNTDCAGHVAGHDRGVRAAHRTRRSAARGCRRSRRREPADGLQLLDAQEPVNAMTH